MGVMLRNGLQGRGPELQVQNFVASSPTDYPD